MLCVILAGGLGTRLRSVVSNVPKPMAEVLGKPFLQWQMDYLISQGVDRFVISVGYKAQIIMNHFGFRYRSTSIKYSIEERALGTGGGLLKSLQYIDEETFLVINGDTFFPVRINKLYELFRAKCDPIMIMALFRADLGNRFGSITTNSADQSLSSFGDNYAKVGSYANAGLYLFDTNRLRKYSDRFSRISKVSFENEMLGQICQIDKVFCLEYDEALLDIGTPKDYARISTKLKSHFNV